MRLILNLVALALNEQPSPLTYIVISVVASVLSSILVQAIGQLMRSNMYERVQQAHDKKLADHDDDIRILRDTVIELATVCRMKFEMNPDPTASGSISQALKRLNTHISKKGGQS